MTAPMSPTAALEQVRTELTPSGVLRVGLNLSNFLLIKPKTPPGVFEGIVPDLARALAAELGVEARFVPYPSPGPLGDAAGQGEWDVAFLADEPARAQTIAFSPAYLEIPASYLVPAGSALRRVEDVDRPGVRIATMKNSAYELYLRRSLKNAQLVDATSLDESFRLFVEQGLDALSGLGPRLIADHARLPGSTILPGAFTAVQQAVGTARKNAAAAAFLSGFVERAKASGLVQRAIDGNAIKGVNVAPARS
jgi:polar amino acid transport system substrate-binding protein